MYQSTNNTSFHGGFYIKTPAQNSRAAVVNKVTSMTKHHKIYRDFNGSNDTMFIAVPPKLDSSVKKIIDILSLKYKYYPQIDPWMNNLKSESGLRRLLSRLVIKNENITDTLNIIGIKQGNYSLYERNGAKIIKNKTNNDTIIISPENRERTRYIKILPGQSQSDVSSQFFAVRNGKIVHEFKTLTEISKFNEKYNNTLFRTNIIDK